MVHTALGIFERLDRTFALRVTIRYIFHPLYQDRSIIGYLLGFLFRFFRIVIGAGVYAVVWAIFAAVYIGWAAVPFLLIYLAFKKYGAA